MANIKDQLKKAGITGELVSDYSSKSGSSYGSYKGLQEARKAALSSIQNTGSSGATQAGQSYSYVDTSGKLQSMFASNSDEAIKNAPNIASNSGVMLNAATQGSASKTSPKINSSASPVVDQNKKRGMQSGADSLAGIMGGDPMANWYADYTETEKKRISEEGAGDKMLIGRKVDLALARSDQQYNTLMKNLDKEYQNSLSVAKTQSAAINPYGSQSTSEMQYADTLSKNYSEAADSLTSQARMAQEALELGEIEAYMDIKKGMDSSYSKLTQGLYSALSDIQTQKTQAEQFSLNQQSKAVDDYRQSFSYAGIPSAQELQNMTVDELMNVSQVQFGLKAGMPLETIIGDISRGSFKQQQMDISSARTEAYLANIGSLMANRGSDGYDGGLDSKEATMFNSLVDKYNKSPIVAANDKAQVLRDVSGALKANPNDSSLQLSFIYGFVKALDSYDSAVREGEIGLLKETQGVKDKLQNIIPKLERGSIINPESITRYINTAELLTNSIQTTANSKKTQFSNQARIANKNVGTAFEEYMGGGSSTQNNNPLGI